MTTAVTAAPQQLTSSKPNSPADWPIARIIEMLSRELPQSMLDTKTLKGNRITYIPWHVANRILDKYAPGWTWEITNMTTTSDRIFITGRLTIPAAEGNLYREATGTETLKEEYFDKEQQVKKIREIAYGDPSSNAESMAFRRCAAKFGLGLYLYQK